MEPLAQSTGRPDIVDRKGRTIATDLLMPSLYADPRAVIDRDEVVEKLATVLPGLDTRALLSQLANRDRRFIWIKRGITPELQIAIDDLGLAGLGFRREPHRLYPRGLVGQFLGQVSFENRGLSGLERALDELSPDARRHYPAVHAAVDRPLGAARGEGRARPRHPALSRQGRHRHRARR